MFLPFYLLACSVKLMDTSSHGHFKRYRLEDTTKTICLWRKQSNRLMLPFVQYLTDVGTCNALYAHGRHHIRSHDWIGCTTIEIENTATTKTPQKTTPHHFICYTHCRYNTCQTRRLPSSPTIDRLEQGSGHVKD